MRLSVVIASRLERSRNGSGALLLERAVASVERQTLSLDVEILVGLDHGVAPPDALRERSVVWRNAPRGGGQAAAMNAALAPAQGDVIAFLEDDDWWGPRHLEFAVPRLDYFSFVSSVQLLFDESDTYKGIFDYPTPSGWVMRRALADEIGPFNEEYRYHLDSEWLGRLNRTGHRRCHLVEATARLSRLGLWRRDLRHFYTNAPAGSRIDRLDGAPPQVHRLVNRAGGMARIAAGGSAQERSRAERRLLERNFGGRYW
jgi:glycosyltransferase involved in cell wall biosynthesis